MNRKLKAISAILVVAMMLLAGCTDNTPEVSNVNERLDALDDFKQTMQEQRIASGNEHGVMQAYATFRNILYGSSMSTVKQLETLEIVEEYDNAIDFELVAMYGYSMLPTYWFNSSGQLYRGSYYAQTQSNMKSVIDSLLAQLNSVYGDALEINYYTFANKIVNFNSDAAAQQAVSSRQAYFYAWYAYDEIDVEVFIEVDTPDETDTVFEVFVNFTDYDFDDAE